MSSSFESEPPVGRLVTGRTAACRRGARRRVAVALDVGLVLAAWSSAAQAFTLKFTGPSNRPGDGLQQPDEGAATGRDQPGDSLATEGNASADRRRQSLRRFTPPPTDARPQRKASAGTAVGGGDRGRRASSTASFALAFRALRNWGPLASPGVPRRLCLCRACRPANLGRFCVSSNWEEVRGLDLAPARSRERQRRDACWPA